MNLNQKKNAFNVSVLDFKRIWLCESHKFCMLYIMNWLTAYENGPKGKHLFQHSAVIRLKLKVPNIHGTVALTCHLSTMTPNARDGLSTCPFKNDETSLTFEDMPVA